MTQTQTRTKAQVKGQSGDPIMTQTQTRTQLKDGSGEGQGQMVREQAKLNGEAQKTMKQAKTSTKNNGAAKSMRTNRPATVRGTGARSQVSNIKRLRKKPAERSAGFFCFYELKVSTVSIEQPQSEKFLHYLEE